MRWNKFKRTLAEHPYLLDDAFKMSVRQAEAIQEKEGFPSFEEMVNSAKMRFDLSASAWEPVNTVLNQHTYKHIFRSFRIRRSHVFKRIAIIGLGILLVAVYLTFTPSGRTLASSIKQAVLVLFDNGFKATSSLPAVRQGNNSGGPSLDEYPDYHAFMEDIGRAAIWLEDDALTLISLTAFDDEISYTLTSVYQAANGGRATMHQTWNCSELAGDKQPEEEWREEKLSDGTSLYCLINSEDGSFFGIATWRDSNVLLLADAKINYQQLIANLKMQ